MPDVDLNQHNAMMMLQRIIMRTDDLDFYLPLELIAQTPAPDRAESRLLHYDRQSHLISHYHFRDLPGLLRKGDLLVFNDAKVTPARFTLRKATGGIVEGLFLSEVSPGTWRVMLKNAGRFASSVEGAGFALADAPPPSAKAAPTKALHFTDAPEIAVRIQDKIEDHYLVKVDSPDPALVVLARVGRMPLPPYIRREKQHDDRDDLDRQRYQTVFAKHEGSVAAPTAGLHFTESVLTELAQLGIEKTFLTLHVGLGTFKPVIADTLEAHHMHTESYTIPPEAADAINRAKAEGRRVIPVGTTSTRVLESQPAGMIQPRSGETDIFIYPPYQLKHVNALITNFHLPRSTLIALVGAVIGLDELKRAYAEAIAHQYRFFSYGDAMFIE